MFAEAQSTPAPEGGTAGSRGRTRKEGREERKGNVRRPDKQAKVRVFHGKDEGTSLDWPGEDRES